MARRDFWIRCFDGMNFAGAYLVFVLMMTGCCWCVLKAESFLNHEPFSPLPWRLPATLAGALIMNQILRVLRRRWDAPREFPYN